MRNILYVSTQTCIKGEKVIIVELRIGLLYFKAFFLHWVYRKHFAQFASCLIMGV